MLILVQVSIVALKDGQIEVVQASMLGSILSNLLLVMGMCFLFGGLVHRGTSGNGSEQSFSAAVAQATCSLMTLSSASLVIPAAVSFPTVAASLFDGQSMLTNNHSSMPFWTRATVIAMRRRGVS